MNDAVIQVDGLGKSYRIPHNESRERYTALRDVMANHGRYLWRQAKRSMRGEKAEAGRRQEVFWALRDVSFEVRRGDVIGIIGSNGAGKSTLLKILSRITEPTLGRASLRGRVASLLEVGTGFHPELTGRENIFLNGAILGMRRSEMLRRFDEIVAFAEVDRFLDTPVKRYSSGMYVRLAFAVAAHLDPEILIIDEVLAVGDAQFQDKCLGAMRSLSRNACRTVLFVSHNLDAVEAICNAALHLKHGTVADAGTPSDLIRAYLSSHHTEAHISPLKEWPLGEGLTLSRLSASPSRAPSGAPVEIGLELIARAAHSLMEFCVLFYNSAGIRAGILDLRRYPDALRIAASETKRITLRISTVPLVEDNYSIGLWVSSPTLTAEILNVASLSVGPALTAISYSRYPTKYRGVVEFDFSLCNEQRSDG